MWISLSPIKPSALIMINTLGLISVNLPHGRVLVYTSRNEMAPKRKCLYGENQASTRLELNTKKLRSTQRGLGFPDKRHKAVI